MNNIVIGIVGVVVAISVFLLLDSDENPNINTTAVNKVTQINEKSENSEKRAEERDDDIKIEYTQTKEFDEKKETKEEAKVVKKETKDADRYSYSEEVERVITENRLTSIQTPNSENVTFKDKSGKYEAEIMVNNVTQRDTSMFPQIPILTSVTLPTGEVINAQIDPSLARKNDKIFIKVKDSETGENKIYNISSVANLNSGEKASVNLGTQGAGESTQVQKQGESVLPPMPPVN